MPTAENARMSRNDTEKPRWFRDVEGSVREYPSRRYWVDGTLLKRKTLLSMQYCIDDGDIELDGPPPHGKPLVPQHFPR